MPCPSFESLILESVDRTLPPERQRELETHLALCSDCQALANTALRLDAALTRAAASTSLSPDFDRRLWSRIATQPHLDTDTARADKKRQLDSEFQRRAAEWRRRVFNLGGVLDGLGLAMLATLAGYGLYQLALAAGLGSPTPALWRGGNLPWLALLSAAGVLASLGLARRPAAALRQPL
jgi:hypothetical protein